MGNEGRVSVMYSSMLPFVVGLRLWATGTGGTQIRSHVSGPCTVEPVAHKLDTFPQQREPPNSRVVCEQRLA